MKSLKRANIWSKELGDLWKEDQFRYVIAQELQKGKGKEYWGQIAGGSTSANPKLVLERSYTNKSERNKARGREIDIVSINTDRRRKNKGTFSNPLAVEVKAQKSLGIKKMEREIKRVRGFLSKNRGERYYELGVVINGNTITKESDLMKSLTKSSSGNNLLVGWLDENKNPVLMWEKRSESSKKKSKIGSKSNPYPTKGDAEKGRNKGTVWYCFRGNRKNLKSMKK
jgi:hypothetical protein